MKKLSFTLLVCILSGMANAQNAKFDTVAVAILDHMSELMGQLNSCSAVVRSNYDVASEQLGLVKHSDVSHVYVSGSNHMLVRSEGDKGSRDLVYDGKTLSYYSMEKNHYAQTKTPANLIEMVDYMNKTYGIVFPLSDFLYPTFVDDILHDANNLVYLGMTKVGDKDCFHIAGTAKDKTFQFWVADDAMYLPVKLVIVYTTKPLNPQFEATYSDWQLNPTLPDGIFEFKAPANAKKIKLTPLSAKK